MPRAEIGAVRLEDALRRVLGAEAERVGVLEAARQRDRRDAERAREARDVVELHVLGANVDRLVQAPELAHVRGLDADGAVVAELGAVLGAEAEDGRQPEPHARVLALLPRVLEDRGVWELHLDLGGRVDPERQLRGGAEVHVLVGDRDDAEVAARRDDRADVELAERVVGGSSGALMRRSGGLALNTTLRLERADERLEADADADLLDRLVREVRARDDERRAVEGHERVARGRRLARRR